MKSPQVIHMISGPRNISTAMLYSFDNRPDCVGIDEPFYAFYLNQNPSVQHPGREEIVHTMDTSYAGIIDSICMQMQQESYLFIKNMSHHIYGADLSWMTDHKVIMLIRDPKKVLYSFSKVVASPSAKDIGIIEEWEIYNQLNNNDVDVIVIDTDDFLLDPNQSVHRLCAALEIPYDDDMLRWSAGPRPIDGCWASHWYTSVHDSTGFVHREKQSEPILSSQLMCIYDEVKEYYAALKEKKMTL